MCLAYRPILFTRAFRLFQPIRSKLDIVHYVSVLYGTSTFQVEPKLKKRAPGQSPRTFVNSKRVLVEAGSGGDGCIAFERIFGNAKAGPNGGDGGNGGHVILQASYEVTDLAHIPSIVRANNGSRGHKDNCHGACAKHTYLKVPVGTQILLLPNPASSTDSSAPSNTEYALSKPQQIGLLAQDSEIFVAAHGGSGGKGNAFLTNSAHVMGYGSTADGRNPPLRIAERGARGECRRLLLRMTQLAQLGLVGAPNAGKSTLLRCITRARPKVAPYPFTTVKPQMGVLMGSESVSSDAPDDTHPVNLDRVTVADLPGLVAGAAEHNVGLGAQFLSLIADCRLLACVVDVGTLWQRGREQPQTDRIAVLTDEIAQQLIMLQHELGTFDSRLTDPRRCLLIGTKMDLIVPESSRPATADRLWHVVHQGMFQAALNVGLITSSDSDRVLLISARRGDNVETLAQLIRRHVSTNLYSHEE